MQSRVTRVLFICSWMMIAFHGSRVMVAGDPKITNPFSQIIASLIPKNYSSENASRLVFENNNHISFYLLHFNRFNFDDSQDTLDVVLEIGISWKDPQLTFSSNKSAQFKGLRFISLNPKDKIVYKPDIIEFRDKISKIPLQIYSSGHSYMNLMFVKTIKCSRRLGRVYPSDAYSCALEFSTSDAVHQKQLDCKKCNRYYKFLANYKMKNARTKWAVDVEHKAIPDTKGVRLIFNFARKSAIWFKWEYADIIIIAFVVAFQHLMSPRLLTQRLIVGALSVIDLISMIYRTEDIPAVALPLKDPLDTVTPACTLLLHLRVLLLVQLTGLLITGCLHSALIGLESLGKRAPLPPALVRVFVDYLGRIVLFERTLMNRGRDMWSHFTVRVLRRKLPLSVYLEPRGHLDLTGDCGDAGDSRSFDTRSRTVSNLDLIFDDSDDLGGAGRRVFRGKTAEDSIGDDRGGVAFGGGLGTEPHAAEEALVRDEVSWVSVCVVMDRVFFLAIVIFIFYTMSQYANESRK